MSKPRQIREWTVEEVVRNMVSSTAPVWEPAAELAFYSRFTTEAKKELEALMGQKSEVAAGALAVLRKLFERAEKET